MSKKYADLSKWSARILSTAENAARQVVKVAKPIDVRDQSDQHVKAFDAFRDEGRVNQRLR